MQSTLLAAVTSSLLTIGCMASGQVHGTAHLTAPSMVYISSDVQVIEDYREPIFYTDAFYWRYSGGVWYRSSQYTSGWVRYSVVPAQITRIERPSAYIHYRASAHANGNARSSSPAIAQEQRQERKEEAKEERKEAKQEQQQERKEAKQEQQQERKESKAEQKEDRKENPKGGKK
jgi:hypothetical protein